MKLNLGCGNDLRNGYVNIDIAPINNLDHQIDASNLDDVCNDEEVDEILAVNVLNMLSYKEILNVLQHWVDKLKPGGTIKVVVPDLVELSRAFLNGELKSDHFILQMYGKQEHEHDFHRTGFDVVLLQSVLETVKMQVISKRILNATIVMEAEKPNV